MSLPMAILRITKRRIGGDLFVCQFGLLFVVVVFVLDVYLDSTSYTNNHDSIRGVLMVQQGDVKGYVCDDEFGATEAAVACSQMGYL